jgi:hypothetical protein
MFDYSLVSYTSKEAAELLLAAKNLNASAKSFLKALENPSQSDVRFAKAVRKVAQSHSAQQLENFLERALPEYEAHLFLFARHSLAPVFDKALEVALERYAEDFNKSYTLNDEELNILDSSNFEGLAKKALKDMLGHTLEAKLPVNGFTASALAYNLFDEPIYLHFRELNLSLPGLLGSTPIEQLPD